MKASGIFRVFGLILAVGLLLAPSAMVFAHGSTTVGDYTLEIGFKNEPALQGVLNGLELVVTNTGTEQPVTGLEESLQAEIIFGASKKTLELEPVEGEEGAYTAAILPTEVGDYTWRIFGKIEDTPVDVSMTSSPTTFVSVVPQSEAAFPNSGPGADAQAAALAQANRRALIGIAAGVVGILIGVISLAAALRRRIT
jgi:hypothetical protein